jgi:hypothetical protein
MTTGPDQKTAKQQRAERLAEALRENLKRRKSQARERKTATGTKPSTPSPQKSRTEN